MKDKKQDVKSLVEFKKAVVEFGNKVNDFVEIFSKLLPDVESSNEEDTWEMKCPYEYGNKYYFLQSSGDSFLGRWDNIEADNRYFSQGNIFPTEQAAELESKRRNLLTRFRAFRDECNDGWKPDWRKNDAKYYLYKSSTTGDILCNDIYFYETFPLFGYFKNEKDAERAIELFGDEIKELFVECD